MCFVSDKFVDIHGFVSKDSYETATMHGTEYSQKRIFSSQR